MSVDGIDADVMPAGPICIDHAHAGSYDGLYLATRGLLQLGWGSRVSTSTRTHRQGRGLGEPWIEWYETNPAETTDPGEWVTHLTFHLAS